MYLGAIADPKSGKVVVDLNGAQFCIDLLQVLEEKTKGNLTDDEEEELRLIGTELRSRFVQISQLEIGWPGSVAPRRPSPSQPISSR